MCFDLVFLNKIYIYFPTAGQNTMQYTSGDVSKLMSFTPILNGLELQYPISNFSNGLPVNCGVNSSKVGFPNHGLNRNNVFTWMVQSYILTSIFQLDKCRKLLQIAEKCLEGGNYFGGIEACNEILDGHGRNIGVIFKHDSLCTRAALLLKVLFWYVNFIAWS